jgi:hypothetical protein
MRKCIPPPHNNDLVAFQVILHLWSGTQFASCELRRDSAPIACFQILSNSSLILPFDAV